MTFDFYFLNDELEKLGFQKLPPERFRCSMKVFGEIMKNNFPELKVKKKLIDCCNYLNIKPYSLDGLFHNGLFDTIMTAKLICKLYEFNQGKFKKDDLLKNIIYNITIFILIDNIFIKIIFYIYNFTFINTYFIIFN